MLDEYSVKVTYKDRETHELTSRVFPFEKYCKNERIKLLKLIEEVEGVCSDKNSFNKIRSFILDSANNIGRLPETLMYRNLPVNSVNASLFIADILNKSSK